MFRIECFVEKKKIGDVLTLIAGLVLDLKVLPVVNAKAKGGKVNPITNGSTEDMFRAYVKQHNLETVKAPQLRDFQKSIGRSPLGYSYLIDKLKTAGILKKFGKGYNSYYKVVTS